MARIHVLYIEDTRDRGPWRNARVASGEATSSLGIRRGTQSTRASYLSAPHSRTSSGFHSTRRSLNAGESRSLLATEMSVLCTSPSFVVVGPKRLNQCIQRLHDTEGMTGNGSKVNVSLTWTLRTCLCRLLWHELSELIKTE